MFEKNDTNITNQKDANNKGISFDDILHIFDYPYFYKIYGIKHSDAEQGRYNGFGYVEKSVLSVVQTVYTENMTDTYYFSTSWYIAGKENVL